jgi:predicted SPOUT superfamily RNA methylase MTH1
MPEFAIALPSSLLMEDRELRDKTVKVGTVARSAAIFRVQWIYIYDDPKERSDRDSNLTVQLLEYLETPQYLRRRLYPIRPDLRFAGLLPPLKIPSHKKEARLIPGEFREGVLVGAGDRTMVYLGVDSPVRYVGTGKVGARQTVRVESSPEGLVGVQVSRREVGEYWGYTVHRTDDVLRLAEGFDIRVATSRLGRPISEVWEELKSRLKIGKKCLILFGAPKRGIFDMFPRKELEKRFDFVLNTIPSQGVETVRTEEALTATLEAMTLASNLT